MEYSKQERLSEFFRRLLNAEPAHNASEARSQLTNILNEVENEMTSIPYGPSRWESDGRLYPPMDDSVRKVQNRKDVVRYRHVAHNTFIGNNGSIEIQDLKGNVLFQKAGADGKGVWDQ
jgi:hypothetical protein